MTKWKATRRSVSIRGETYDKLRAFGSARDLSLSSLFEELAERLLSGEIELRGERRPAPRRVPRRESAPTAARPTTPVAALDGHDDPANSKLKPQPANIPRRVGGTVVF